MEVLVGGGGVGGVVFFFFQAEDGIRDYKVTGVQTCALPIFFAVDGQSTEDLTHDDLVDKIKACKTNMR